MSGAYKAHPDWCKDACLPVLNTTRVCLFQELKPSCTGGHLQWLISGSIGRVPNKKLLNVKALVESLCCRAERVHGVYLCTIKVPRSTTA